MPSGGIYKLKKNTALFVLDQQQRAPFPWSELSHQLLLKLQNNFCFLGSFRYFNVSFYTNTILLYAD